MAPFGMEDFVARHNTKSGMFSVRSAYHAEWSYRFGRHERNLLGVEGSHIIPGVEEAVELIWVVSTIWNIAEGCRCTKHYLYRN